MREGPMNFQMVWGESRCTKNCQMAPTLRTSKSSKWSKVVETVQGTPGFMYNPRTIRVLRTQAWEPTIIVVGSQGYVTSKQADATWKNEILRELMYVVCWCVLGAVFFQPYKGGI